jgi:predicted CopG family antitoxin
MATKTISLKTEAYERLKRARRHPNESFSEVVMRAHWNDEPTTAADYLRLVRERGPSYSTEELERLEAAKASDLPPGDKWQTD